MKKKDLILIGIVLFATLALFLLTRLPKGQTNNSGGIVRPIASPGSVEQEPSVSSSKGETNSGGVIRPIKSPGSAEQEPPDSSSKGEVVIYIGSEVYKRVPLGEPQTVIIDQGGGKVNELHITEDGAVMHSATCDNQDCIKQGEVTLGNYQSRVLGSWIICLPNQVSVELYAGEEQ